MTIAQGEVFAAAKGVVDEIPAMAVQGNHETYNPPDFSSTKPVDWLSQFNLPQNGPDGLKGQTYSYDYGNVHIVVLDSQESEEQSIAGDILVPQEKWLDNDLKSTNKEWKLVFFHKTPYYNKATRSNEDLKAAFGPIFDKYHVDMVFNGHDHGIARTYPIYNDTLVGSPAKGTVYYVTGRSGNKYYNDLSQKVWDEFFYDPQDEPNYLVAELQGDNLTIKAVKMDGTLVDSYTINKASGTDLPRTLLPPKYNQTRMAVYGNVLNQPLVPVPPKQISGKWYVPFNAFVEYIGGSVSGTSCTINGTTYTPNIIVDSKVNMISVDDLSALFGFTSKYDGQTNLLMLTK